MTFHHRKKLFYAISSLILSSVLLFIGIFDIIAVTVLQNPNLSTHKFMKTVMVRKRIITNLMLRFYSESFFFCRYYTQSRFISHSLASFTHMNQSLISYQRWHSLPEVCGLQNINSMRIKNFSTYRTIVNFVSDKNCTRTFSIRILPN